MPISWQGWAVIAAMVTVCVPFGLVFLLYADTYPVLGWGAGVIAVAAAFAGHAVVVWKLERDYRS